MKLRCKKSRDHRRNIKRVTEDKRDSSKIKKLKQSAAKAKFKSMKNQEGKDQKPTTADRAGKHGGRQNELMKTEEGGTEKRHEGTISKQNRKQEQQFTVCLFSYKNISARHLMTHNQMTSWHRHPDTSTF